MLLSLQSSPTRSRTFAKIKCLRFGNNIMNLEFCSCFPAVSGKSPWVISSKHHEWTTATHYGLVSLPLFVNYIANDLAVQIRLVQNYFKLGEFDKLLNMFHRDGTRLWNAFNIYLHISLCLRDYIPREITK